jgi:DNA-binding beta-propeller fold protein YncE
MKKKGFFKCMVFCFAVLFLAFHGISDVQAGEFQFETQAGFTCPALFGCPAPNGFWGSSAITVDSSQGIVYVFDLLNARVHKYDADLNFQGHLTVCPDPNPQTETYCSDPGEINYSPSMAVSPGGEFIYISDPRNYRIHKFADDGTWLLSWGLFETVYWPFREPSGIAVDADGYVYVTDILDSTILVFDENGIVQDMWIHPSATGDDFRPTGIHATDKAIYVTDYLNSVLYDFQPNGQIKGSWGGYDGNEVGEFVYPSDVSVDAAGNIFVADTLNNRIQVINDTPAAYSGSVDEGPINRPFSIAADDSGNVYVADTFNSRVLKYAYTP